MCRMIKTFRSKALAELWSSGKTAKIDARMQGRILEWLDVLEAAEAVEEMNIPGFDFHSLKGRPKRYTVHVNGPWCITFEFDKGNAYRLDFEQYH